MPWAGQKGSDCSFVHPASDVHVYLAWRRGDGSCTRKHCGPKRARYGPVKSLGVRFRAFFERHLEDANGITRIFLACSQLRSCLYLTVDGEKQTQPGVFLRG
jgi:hypothetical protein